MSSVHYIPLRLFPLKRDDLCFFSYFYIKMVFLQGEQPGIYTVSMVPHIIVFLLGVHKKIAPLTRSRLMFLYILSRFNKVIMEGAIGKRTSLISISCRDTGILLIMCPVGFHSFHSSINLIQLNAPVPTVQV